MCSYLERLAGELEAAAHPALDALTNNVSTTNLERVRRIKNRMVRLTTRVETVSAGGSGKGESVVQGSLDSGSVVVRLGVCVPAGGRGAQQCLSCFAPPPDSSLPVSSTLQTCTFAHGRPPAPLLHTPPASHSPVHRCHPPPSCQLREVLEKFLDDDGDMRDMNLTALEAERQAEATRQQMSAMRAAGGLATPMDVPLTVGFGEVGWAGLQAGGRPWQSSCI